VSGSVSIVNGNGNSITSVVLIVEETFNTNLERGDVPKGLRASNVTGAVVHRRRTRRQVRRHPVARQPTARPRSRHGISGTMIQHITVAGAPVMVTASR